MIKYFILAVCLSSGPVFGGEEAPWKQITVTAGDLGDIVGAEMVTSKNFDRYYTFTGIPYADPLSYTGAKRFEVYYIPVIQSREKTPTQFLIFLGLNIAFSCSTHVPSYTLYTLLTVPAFIHLDGAIRSNRCSLVC